MVVTGQVWKLIGIERVYLRIDPDVIYETEIQREQSIRIVSNQPVGILVQKSDAGPGFRRVYYDRVQAYRVELLKRGKPVRSGYIELRHFETGQFELVGSNPN